jgi:hypothetical protein
MFEDEMEGGELAGMEAPEPAAEDDSEFLAGLPTEPLGDLGFAPGVARQAVQSIYDQIKPEFMPVEAFGFDHNIASPEVMETPQYPEVPYEQSDLQAMSSSFTEEMVGQTAAQNEPQAQEAARAEILQKLQQKKQLSLQAQETLAQANRSMFGAKGY